MIPQRRLLSHGRHTARSASVDDDEKAMECFFVYTDEVVNEGATPEVACTTQPDEYAWFNGVDREKLIPTEGEVLDGAVECVEGASPRGVPEWECRTSKDSVSP